MELYWLFDFFSNIFSTKITDPKTGLPSDYYFTSQSFYLTLFIAIGVFVALTVLQGFGLYRMAKNRNIKRKWLSFVPFANVYMIGKVAGQCSFFGHKMKRAWLYVLIFQVFSFAFCVMDILAVWS